MTDGDFAYFIAAEGNNLVSSRKSGAVRVFDIGSKQMAKSMEAENKERVVWAIRFRGEANRVPVYRQRGSTFLAAF